MLGLGPQTDKYHVFEEKIGRKLTVDTVVTFDIDEPNKIQDDGIGGRSLARQQMNRQKKQSMKYSPMLPSDEDETLNRLRSISANASSN